jgi:hypothetical protein
MSSKAMMTRDIYLPWVSASTEPEYGLPDFPEHVGFEVRFVDVTFVLHGKAPRTRTLSVPSKQTCVDLKGHLAVEGVVPTCGGLEVAFEENEGPIDDSTELHLTDGQVMHLRRAAEMISITALTTSDPTAQSMQPDEEVYELVLPSELNGLTLKEQIVHATGGVLQPLAVFIAAGEAMHPFAVGDEEEVVLSNDQVILVQRAVAPQQVLQAPQAAVQAVPLGSSASGGGFLNSIASRLRGPKKTSVAQGPPRRFCLREAANIKVNGATIACTSKAPWAAAAVFDVPDPLYFQITVQLNADAPLAESDGLAGRWMVGVVPSAAAEVKTEKQRQRLLGLGHFLTVCHGHPAKIHAPSMPRGTCGEDCAMLPGELRRGQSLTLSWVGSAQGGLLTAQVDDGDLVTLAYAPAVFDDVRPCLVLGGKATEVRIPQLVGGVLGGA